MWWYIPIILAFKRQRLEGCEFWASLSYIDLSKKRKKKTKEEYRRGLSGWYIPIIPALIRPLPGLGKHRLHGEPLSQKETDAFDFLAVKLSHPQQTYISYHNTVLIKEPFHPPLPLHHFLSLEKMNTRGR